MNIEVLAAVMNKEPNKIIKSMNLNSNAIIINQCEKNEYIKIKYNNYEIDFYSFNERGVGLSRNNALMRATGDIIVFADEDMKYVNNYNDIIVEAFKNNPKADMIVFNVLSSNPKRPTVKILSNKKVHLFNCLKYGAVNFAVKREILYKYNIYFSLLFGGGAKYSAGEDSLFIYEFIKAGGRVYTDSNVIGTVAQTSSTWFKGYTKKFFYDKGALYACLSKRLCRILCLQFLLRHKFVLENITFSAAYSEMKKGISEILK